MSVPRIIYQTSPRWLVITKPRGWSLASRSANAKSSIEAFLPPILGKGDTEKLYFPIEVDTRMSAIAVACCDKGMLSQFERFKSRNELAFTFRIMVESGFIPFTNKAVPPELLISPIEEDGHTFVDIESDRYLPFRDIANVCENRVKNENVSLYQLRFPDPMNPKVDEITIAVPAKPSEGWNS